MKQHIHHVEIKAWADGAEIESYSYYLPMGWKICKYPSWGEHIKYRVKPQTHTINGFEVPLPLSPACFPIDAEAFAENAWNLMYVHTVWGAIQPWQLKRGIIHATKEGAIANCKARLGIDPNS